MRRGSLRSGEGCKRKEQGVGGQGRSEGVREAVRSRKRRGGQGSGGEVREAVRESVEMDSSGTMKDSQMLNGTDSVTGPPIVVHHFVWR